MPGANLCKLTTQAYRRPEVKAEPPTERPRDLEFSQPLSNFYDFSKMINK